ncbi:MAG: FecR family protein [Leptolyngbya sp. SIO1D8]|nr:FecR family protein [Leptolyngbya sp. SIO1D8]
MNGKIDPELLRKFFNEECDKNEYQQVIDWVNSSSNSEEVLSFIEKHWISEKRNREKAELDYFQILGDIRKGIEESGTPLQPVGARYSLTRQLLKVAAILLFPVLMLGIYYLAQKKSEDRKLTYEQKSNQRGQKSRVSLPDGTVVWLNSESSLRYVSGFTDNKREVILEGEAFFEVAKRENLPFKVITGEIETVALGTSFNINSFPENGALGISLVTGKVAISHQQPGHDLSAVVLSPGEKLLFDPVLGDFKKLSFGHKKELSWRKGVIYFENANIEHISATLERWFDVNIVFKNQVKRPWHFSGEFDNSSLERVLERMAYTEKFSFELSEDTVTIEFE